MVGAWATARVAAPEKEGHTPTQNGHGRYTEKKGICLYFLGGVLPPLEPGSGVAAALLETAGGAAEVDRQPEESFTDTSAHSTFAASKHLEGLPSASFAQLYSAARVCSPSLPIASAALQKSTRSK